MQYPNPWSFSNSDHNLLSPNGLHRIEFGALQENAMGGPLRGECFVVSNSRTMRIGEECGGPIVWNTASNRIALPLWTKSREQKIAVVDLENMTIIQYKKCFRVLELQSFEGEVIKGKDSPIHKTTTIDFDTNHEEIERIFKLK